MFPEARGDCMGTTSMPGRSRQDGTRGPIIRASRTGSRAERLRQLTPDLLPALLTLLLACPALLRADVPEPCPMPRDVTVPPPGELGPDVVWPVPGLPTSPPDNPQIGDSWLWWLWVGETWPPNFEQRMCTVRGISDRGYVVVRDDEWLVDIDQADVDLILDSWENWSIGPLPDLGIYELDSLAFGAPPDELDRDPRIYLLYHNVGMVAAGYFFMFDEYLEGTFPGYHSNECEVCYLNPVSPGGPSGEMMLAVAAHEFMHMIHWKYDENEMPWVNEGLAELAMWLYGAGDPIFAFNTNPDLSLVTWDGTWADYIKAYLWSLYFYERYGGLEATYALVHEPANSILGYENVLDDLGYSQSFADVFGDWIVANYLDDTTIEDGRFGYSGADLPAFSLSGTYSTYPVAPTYGTVNHWAADYYGFSGLSSYGSILLSFDGDDTNKYRVWGLAIHADGSKQVHPMPIDDPTQTGALWIGGLTDPADQVVLVVGGASSTGGTGYCFSASASSDVEPGPGTPPMMAVEASPNPFASVVALHLRWSGEPGCGTPRLSVYDVRGRLVASPVVDAGAGEAAEVSWNGLDRKGLPCPTGVYVARAEYGSCACNVVLTLLRGSGPR